VTHSSTRTEIANSPQQTESRNTLATTQTYRLLRDSTLKVCLRLFYLARQADSVARHEPENLPTAEMASRPSSIASTPSPSSSSCATADFSRFPTPDVACAVGSTDGINSNISTVFDKCCKSAPVEPFNGPCGYYCLAVQQSVSDLQTCFQNGGIIPNQIFCNGTNSATATSTPTSSARNTGASGSATGGPAASGTDTPDNTGAAVQGVSKMSLGVLGMIFASVMAGTLL